MFHRILIFDEAPLKLSLMPSMGCGLLKPIKQTAEVCLVFGEAEIDFPGLRPDHDIWCVGLLGCVRRDNRPNRQLLPDVPTNFGRVWPL